MKKDPKLGFNQYILPFKRDSFSRKQAFTYMGDGRLGGKGRRLAIIKEKISENYRLKNDSPIKIIIPHLCVITTKYFQRFIHKNRLQKLAYSELDDSCIAYRFLQARLPGSLEKDLRALLEQFRGPLAIRSSGLSEDSLEAPLAGIFKSKMLPNNHEDPEVRLHQLANAIKLVFASTFFGNARSYLGSTHRHLEDEKMAIVIQEVMGLLHGSRYYPNVSGVARSYNYYPSGHAKPEDGVVSLALGLGKTIVEGGAVWTYSPEYPEVSPPYNSINDMMKQTQLDFWAIRMKNASESNPIDDTEFLLKLKLEQAEKDGTLAYIASTYDFDSDRINIGIGFGGSRIINFAPLLHVDLIPVNQLIRSILSICEDTFNSKVEIEFALTFDPLHKQPTSFGLLQVRPMAVSEEPVPLAAQDWESSRLLTASQDVLGNGIAQNVKDIVFVNPDNFSPRYSEQVAKEVGKMNQKLLEENIPYLLIGFGRWGTSNPWMGIPVNWGQISGAGAVVELSISGSNADLSQGSHFFHNISNLKVFYFSCGKKLSCPIDWEWLNKQEIIRKRKYVTHIRLKSPLTIKVDGKSRKGVIIKGD